MQSSPIRSSGIAPQGIGRSLEPARAPTLEIEWQAMLSGAPAWSPQTGPLIVVSAHPDDEILGVGGLIHAWAALGHPITIVSVTDGEAAFPDWRHLDLVRRGELRGALRKLCLTHVSVLRMGLPDGRVDRHANRVRNALIGLLSTDATIIAPYERDGHPDHETIGAVCCALRHTHGAAVARYPIWTWQHARPAAMAPARWGRFPLSPEARRAKARAVQCFASQLCPPHAPPAVPPHVLAHFARPYEAFLL
jgi:LmbE family N-acetylglucosaminyl deacetylase